MDSAQLGPAQRARSLERMASESFDIVVVGGGVTGAGAALDAATRGLSVALVEKGDYACGTSSRSSKLVHGGLRYLEHFDFGLVHVAEDSLTATGATLGTPTYMAPEQVDARDRTVDRCTDVYGLGAALYEALTLRPPFAGSTRQALFRAILNDRPAPPRRP